MSSGSVVVQQSRTERPTRHGGAACVQPTPVFLPSMVESMGRTTSVAYSPYNGDWIVGGDVCPPQRYSRKFHGFVGYAAGLGSDGSAVSFQCKKTVAFRESSTYAVVLLGANGGGGIATRAVTDTFWTLQTTSFWGEAQDGGSSDPRRTGSRLLVIDGTTVYASVNRSASPTNGIARSTNSGATWATWEFAATRNYTAIVKSPQYSCLYATSDGRVGSSADGVWAITGLGTGTGTPTRLDNIGAGAPTLLDVRDVYVVNEGTTDTLFVVCGNKAGSDADRGVWRCRINADPTGGGFGSSNVTWSHILTVAASDRPQSVVAFKPNGGSAGPIYLFLNYFKSSTNSTGTYLNSAGAGGATKTYHITAQRTLNADDATPAWDIVSNASNVDMTTFATPHIHVQAYCGEPSAENARWGGTNYAGAGCDISPDGASIVCVGSSTPWRSDNPWALTPIWRPFSRGLGVLENSYSSLRVPATNKMAHSDIDRGMFTYNSNALGYKGPEWCIAEEIDGIVTTANEMNQVSLAVNQTDIYSARVTGARAYITTHPWEFLTAHTTAIAPDTSAGTEAIGCWQWVDGLGVTRILIVTQTAIWRGTTNVKTIATACSRCDFVYSGSNCWLHIADIGIYRSTDNGATWTLWWTYAISNGLLQRMCGHTVVSATNVNQLFVTFDGGGVWRCIDADVSAVGSGLAGSRPGGTSLVTGGALPLGTEPIAAIDVDPYTGWLWAAGYLPAGGALNHVYYRVPGVDIWYQLDDTEWAESGILPEHIRVLDGQIICGTAFGTMRRIA